MLHRSSWRLVCCHSLPWYCLALINQNRPHQTLFDRVRFWVRPSSSASARQVSIYLHPQTRSSSRSPRHRHPLSLHLHYLHHLPRAVLVSAQKTLSVWQTLSDHPAQATCHTVGGRGHPWNELWKESIWRVPSNDGFVLGHVLRRSGCAGYRGLWGGYVLLMRVMSWENHFGRSHYECLLASLFRQDITRFWRSIRLTSSCPALFPHLHPYATPKLSRIYTCSSLFPLPSAQLHSRSSSHRSLEILTMAGSLSPSWHREETYL